MAKFNPLQAITKSSSLQVKTPAIIQAPKIISYSRPKKQRSDKLFIALTINAADPNCTENFKLTVDAQKTYKTLDGAINNTVIYTLAHHFGSSPESRKKAIQKYCLSRDDNGAIFQNPDSQELHIIINIKENLTQALNNYIKLHQDQTTQLPNPEQA